MKKKIIHKFNIKEKDVEKHAPLVYTVIQEHYEHIVRLSAVMNDPAFAQNSIRRVVAEFGILPDKQVPYTEQFLLNDSFKVIVVHHLCFSRIIGKALDWESFILLRSMVEQGIMNGEYGNLSYHSVILKMFNVDPSVLPKTHLSRNMKLDEFIQAVDIIGHEVEKLKSYNQFVDYDEYFEYMKKETGHIESICHAKGYYGTHNIDRFACMAISQKMQLPTFDVLYKVDEVRAPFEIDTEKIKTIQEQILEQMFKK
jgi:hypothetical protein